MNEHPNDCFCPVCLDRNERQALADLRATAKAVRTRCPVCQKDSSVCDCYDEGGNDE